MFRSGWSGSVTLQIGSGATSVVISPDSTSALSLGAAVMSAANTAFSSSDFALTVDGSGKIKLSGDQAFTLTFSGSGNVHSRMGFSSTSYSSALSRTAETTHSGSVYPYATEALRYTLDQPVPARAAFLLQGRAIMARTPALDWRQPDAQVTGLRGVCLDVIEAVVARADTPAKISLLVDPSTVVDVHLGKIKTKTIDNKSGWGSVDLEVAF